MAKNYNLLFEVTPLNGSTPTTLRLTSISADKNATTANGQTWLPCITSMPDFGMDLSSDGLLGDLKIERGEISFFCSNDFTNHVWSSYVWNGAFYRAWFGENGTDFASYTLLGEGRTTNLERDGNQVTVRLLGPEADLTSKLLSKTYAGIGGAEGPLGFKGNLKPRCFGTPLSVEPVELDPVNLVYQVHGYGAVSAIQPYEYGLPLEADQNKGNTASYADLIALPLVPGEYATCLAEGMFRFGGTPTPKITADVTMPGGTMLSDIATAMLLAAGVPSGKIGSFAAVSSVQTNLYVTSQVEALEALQSLFKQAGCILYADKNGVWQCSRFYASAKTAIALNSDRSTFPILLHWKEEPTKPPIKKVSYGFQRCWGVHSDSEASPIVNELAQQAENAALAAQAAQGSADAAQDAADAAQATADIAVGAVKDAQGNVIKSSTLQADIANAKATIDQIKTDTQTDVTNLKNSFNDLDAEVETAKGNISGLQSTTSNLNNSVTTLTGDLSTAKSNIGNLQSSMTAAQADITLTKQVLAAAGGNLLQNTDFDVDTAGWVYSGAWAGATVTGRNIPSADWVIPGTNTLVINQTNATTTGQGDWTQVVPIEPSQWYELSTWYASHRCSTQFYLQWLDSTGAVVSPTPNTPSQSAFGGGKTYADFKRVAVKAQAPGNAVSVRVYLRKWGTDNGQSDSWAWFLKPQLMKTAQNQVSPLPYQSGSPGASVAVMSGALSSATSNIATLRTDVNSQGASITTLQTSMTNAQGNIATLDTRILAGNPNLLKNGGFENGFAGWNGSNWAVSANNGTWGRYAGNSQNGTQVLASDQFPVDAGTTYTISADIAFFATSGSAYVDMLFYNAADQLVLDGPQNPVNPGTQFSNDGTNRKAYKATATAPSGATKAVARLILSNVTGANVGAFRQVKVEAGPNATAYSAEASAIQTFSAISTLNTSYSSLNTRVTSTEGSVTSLQSSMTSANGSISSLQTNVNSLNGSVSTLQQSSSTQAGQISGLQQTVSTQGATISSNSTAITSLEGSVSSLNTLVTASSSPNLLKNGGFENGLDGWERYGSNNESWFRNVWTWGNYAALTAPFSGNVYAYLQGSPIGVAENNVYTLSGECELRSSSGSPYCYFEIVWFNSSGGVISSPSGPLMPTNTSFTSNSSQRNTNRMTVTSPAGASTARVRLVCSASGGTVTLISWRQVKFEFGGIATPYSGEASAQQAYTAYADLNGSFASLSTTVSSQGGSINSLQSSYTSLNGTVSSLSSTVSAQGSSITSLQTTQSNQSGQIASLTNELRAGNPNLIANGSGENGLSLWEVGYGNWGWTNGSNLWGNYIYVSNAGSAGTKYYHLRHTRVPFSAGVQSTFTCGLDVYFSGAGGKSYLEVRYEDNAGNVLASANGPELAGNRGFVNDVATRVAAKCTTAAAPSGTTHVRATVVFYTPDGVSINSAAFRQAKLEVGTVATAYSMEATVNQSFSAIASTNSSLASLTSTVSTQGATINNQATAITNLQGSTSTLTTQVTAGSRNLLRNGGFEMRDMSYWTPVGTTFFVNGGTDTWGPYAGTNNNVPDGSYTYIESNRVNIERDWYTLTADVGHFITNGNGVSYLELVWWNSSGNAISTSGGPSRPQGNNFAANGSGRRALQVTAFAPEGTVTVSARVVWYKANGVSNSMHVRQVKLERGQVATPYSADATIVQAFDTLSSVNQQYASLSQTVSTQGVTVGQHSTAITTINGQVATLAGKYTVGVDAGGRWTGLEINGSPTSGGVKIRGDYLTIENPNGGARTEYRNGYWLATDGQSWMSIWGAPFGNGNRFLRWSGPYFSDLNNCQESNAKEYLRVDGSMYFGGALLAGTLRNSNSTSILAANASTSVGPFGSNGGQIVVAASWSWNSTDTASYPATAQGRSNYDAAIQNLQANGYNITGSNQGGHFGSKTDNKDGNAFALYLNRNGGQVAAEGGCAGSISIEGTRPEPVDNQPGYIRYTYLYSKSITWTDPDRSTMQRTMTATIQRNFTPSGTADQRIGINTVE